MRIRFLLAVLTYLAAGLVREVDARSYEPATGRFLEEDPIFQPGESSYVYAKSNPLKYIDPLGADAILVEWNFTGAYHREVYIGNRYSGYTAIGFSPLSRLSGAFSFLGPSVEGQVDPPRSEPFLPWDIGPFGGRALRRVVQTPQDDALTLAYAKELQHQARWTRYSIWRNSCRDYADDVYGYAERRRKP